MGAVLAAMAVVLGSVGAHGLEDIIAGMEDIEKRLKNWDTGVRYQMAHAIGIVLVGLLQRPLPHRRSCTAAALLMLVGIILFSGCLYVMSLTQMKFLGAIVPLGGLSMIVAWVLLAWAAWQSADGEQAG